MNLEELKTRFKHKTKADLKDIDIALEATPMLVREVLRLEKELGEAQERISHLSKKRPPTARKGAKGAASWEARADEDNNRLYLNLAGQFDPAGAKLASSHFVSIIAGLRDGFDVINDISALGITNNNKVMFHLRKIWYNLEKAGMKRVVRVVSNEHAATALVFDKIISKNIQSETVSSIPEAEALLESVGKHLKA